MSAASAYTIDPKRQVAHLRWADQTSLTEAAMLLDALIGDPAFQRGYSILEDLRTQDGLKSPFVLDAGLQLRETVASRVRPCRWAVVLPPVFLALFDQVRAGAERLHAQEIEFCAFVDFDAALHWASRADPPRTCRRNSSE